MKGMLLRPELGDNLLVVMDNCPACLEMLGAVASNLPRLNHRYFTLLHCCPAIYWEHGGGTDPETRHEIDAVWESEEDEYSLTRQYFDQACHILQQAGVPPSHILTTAAVDNNSVIDATMAELRRGKYTGVIVSSDHHDIINRLHARGLTDIFRRIPKVAAWEIDNESFTRTANP
jgi:hypothetical protein